MTDIFLADVSEFQSLVTDAYPYPVLSIRSNDGTYQDHKFAQNYAWMRNALDRGKLTAGIVYCYWRPNWADTVNTMQAMINANGGLHPKVALMLDVESGGNPGGDQSDGINRAYWALADWAGNPKRVFGYANAGDFNSMWRTRPDGLRMIGAGYGQNPQLPGQIGHQYTDGSIGAGQGLPMGAPPFGPCDMNTAPMSATEFAAALGIGAAAPAAPTQSGGTVALPGDDQPLTVGWFRDFITAYLGPLIQDTKTCREQLTGSRNDVYNADGTLNIPASYPGWKQLGQKSVVDALADVRDDTTPKAAQ